MSNKISPFTSGFNNWKHGKELVTAHENSQQHRDSMVALYERKATGEHVNNNLVKLFENEKGYWRQLLQRIMSVVQFLCARGLSFRSKDERIGSPSNGCCARRQRKVQGSNFPLHHWSTVFGIKKSIRCVSSCAHKILSNLEHLFTVENKAASVNLVKEYQNDLEDCLDSELMQFVSIYNAANADVNTERTDIPSRKKESIELRMFLLLNDSNWIETFPNVNNCV